MAADSSKQEVDFVNVNVQSSECLILGSDWFRTYGVKVSLYKV